VDLKCSDGISKSISFVGIAFTEDKFVVIIVHITITKVTKK